MNARPASEHLTTIRIALFILAVFPSFSQAGWGNDSFSEEGRRNRERAEEERRNAQRRDEEAKRRINAGKDQGERDLAEIDQYIRDAQSSLSLANQKGKEWVEANSREVPANILAHGRRVSSELARIRRERTSCGVDLHSPNKLISDTLRGISELDLAARAVSQEGKRLVDAVGSLYGIDVREELRVFDDQLASAISTINWAKNGIQKLEAEELRAAKSYHQKVLEEQTKAEKRASSQKTQSGRIRVRRSSPGRIEAEEKMRLKAIDSVEAKIQLDTLIRDLEDRHRLLLQRREIVGKKLSRYETTFGEDTEEVKVLKSDVNSFCQEVDNMAKLAEPYLGKAPNGAAAKEGVGEIAAGESTTQTEEGKYSGASPKAKSGSRFVYSWSPWEESSVLSAERR